MDNKKEWLAKAELDYFVPFINLWLACNSWYKSHYLHNVTIFNIKFKHLVETEARDGMNFRHNLENFNTALERATIKPDKIKYCSLQKVLINYTDFELESAYKSIFADNIKLLKSGKPKKEFSNCIKLDKKYLQENLTVVFAGIFETIYIVRNMLVHGSLEPNFDNHSVVKYAYLVLYDMLKTN